MMITVEEPQISMREWGRKRRNQELYRLLDRAVILLENIDTAHFSYYDRIMLLDLLYADNQYNFSISGFRDFLRWEAEIERENYGW